MIIGFAGEKVTDPAVVPAQGGHQRGRQAATRSSSSATARSETTSIVPAPSEKVVFDVEKRATAAESTESGKATCDQRTSVSKSSR